jgi:uncharacterized membrane protein YdjX (TVP38/TMEM64 family)
MIVVAVLALALLSFEMRQALALEWSVESLRGLVARAGVWGPLLYIGILGFRFAVLVPSSILLVASGICFGPLAGTAYATTGLVLSALLKFAFASVAGRDVLLKNVPERLRAQLSMGERRSSAFGLSLICAYPFGPKHIFQIAAILSGMSLWKYTFAVTSGAIFRAGLFATLGEAVASGEGVLMVSLVLLAAGAAPLSIPRVRGWLFSVGDVVS